MKGQRVICPERTMVDIEVFELPDIKDDAVLVTTECMLHFVASPSRSLKTEASGAYLRGNRWHANIQ